jgi:transposase-like protein
MPARKATGLTLSVDQRTELESAVRTHATPQQLALRARIILLCGDGLGITEVAERLGIWRKTVSHWRRCWMDRTAAATIAQRLADAPRPGAKPVFTAEQICALIALACESPSASGLPVTHWSRSDLARQATQRGLVAKISPRSVGRLLKRIAASTASGQDVAHTQARSGLRTQNRRHLRRLSGGAGGRQGRDHDDLH